LDGARQLGGPLFRASGKSPPALGGVRSKGNSGGPGMARSALVAPSALFGQGLASPGNPGFRAARLAADHKPWPKERAPFPVAALLSHVASPRISSSAGFRDAALVSVGLRLMLRPGELVKLRLEDVRFEDDGVKVRMGRSKANQKAERKPSLVEPSKSPACPVK